MSCPGELELSRALTLGAEPELEAHLAACPACRDAWDGARAAIELARELPIDVPSRARREEARTAVLAAAAGIARPARRRPWIAPAIAGAAAAGVIVALAIPRRASPPARPGHGVVHAQPGARYLASAPGPDEIVRLSDGVLALEVEPLHAGERFRVIVGASEIEVRGTAFSVAARGDHLLDVAVTHGRVEVRPDDGAPVTLAAGQAWHAPLVTAGSPPRGTPAEPPARASSPEVPPRAAEPSAHRPRTASAAERPAASASGRSSTAAMHAPGSAAARSPRVAATASPPAPEAPAVPATAGRPPEELSYDAAWEALRAGNFARAASGFARVLLLAPDSALVEDASFWHAVALARGKRSAEALSAFRDFLESYARSARAGEASAMLGWLLIDAHAYDDAARWFGAAAADPSPAVRQSGQAGLDALARRKR